MAQRLGKSGANKMKTVLVTGADGFVGRNLIKKLIERGVFVYAIIHPNARFCFEGNKRVKTIRCDLIEGCKDYSAFDRPIDAMYHFAWAGVKPEERDEVEIQLKNIEISMNCMKLAAATKTKKIIFPGSTNEYLYYGKPIDKYATPSPNNFYGATKVALRYMCSEYASNNGITFVYAIVAGIYSPDRQDNNIITYTINSLLEGVAPSLTTCEQIWDYVYIDDVIEALICLGDKGKDGGVYPIGHGDNWQLKNYIEIIKKEIDPSVCIKYGQKKQKNGKAGTSAIDLSEIYNDTGFAPKVSFEEGIRKVIKQKKAQIKESK